MTNREIYINNRYDIVDDTLSINADKIVENMEESPHQDGYFIEINTDTLNDIQRAVDKHLYGIYRDDIWWYKRNTETFNSRNTIYQKELEQWRAEREQITDIDELFIHELIGCDRPDTPRFPYLHTIDVKSYKILETFT